MSKYTHWRDALGRRRYLLIMSFSARVYNDFNLSPTNCIVRNSESRVLQFYFHSRLSSLSMSLIVPLLIFSTPLVLNYHVLKSWHLCGTGAMWNLRKFIPNCKRNLSFSVVPVEETLPMFAKHWSFETRKRVAINLPLIYPICGWQTIKMKFCLLWIHSILVTILLFSNFVLSDEIEFKSCPRKTKPARWNRATLVYCNRTLLESKPCHSIFSYKAKYGDWYLF